MCCTYKLSDGVSGHGSVGDPVLPHGTFSVVPADGQGAGGGIEHTHVPGTGTWHCTGNTSEHYDTNPSTDRSCVFD